MSWGDVQPRFWAKVEKSEGCWNWVGGKMGDGYGTIMNYDDKVWLAHRLSWVMHVGDIPDGIFVCHRCDNRACVNPDHLFLGTNADNMRDMVKKGRYRKGRTIVGEEHANSRLTREIVLQIRKMTAAGIPQKQVAQELGVSQSTVSLIHQRKAWRHVS